MTTRPKRPTRFEMPVNPKHPELLPPESPIAAVRPLRYISCIRFRRDEIERYIEQPMVEACRLLHDKNVPTTLTSANGEDVERGDDAALFIYYDGLNEANQHVAREVGTIVRGTCVIWIPMSPESTIESVSQDAIAIAERFEAQDALVWPE